MPWPAKELLQEPRSFLVLHSGGAATLVPVGSVTNARVLWLAARVASQAVTQTCAPCLAE